MNQTMGLFVGRSAAMQQVYEAIQKVAPHDLSVAIYGESGTGKELVAKAIHQQSPRSSKPLIDVNCAAIPRDLMESELFGHERGAFSGAIETKPGKFELAQGGTLFLDEVGELPWELQAKFLRVLQERVLWRIGGKSALKVDVRIVVATHRDLEKEKNRGRFREDLYYRLNVFPIHMPPLRNRNDDVVLLAEHFLRQFAPHIPGLHPYTRERLCANRWPGNVRELRNCLERAVLYHDGEGPLMPDTLSLKSFNFSETNTALPLQTVPLTLSQHPPTLDQTICDAIHQSLLRNKFNKSRTAKELGIRRQRLSRMIQRYRLGH